MRERIVTLGSQSTEPETKDVSLQTRKKSEAKGKQIFRGASLRIKAYMKEKMERLVPEAGQPWATILRCLI